MRTRGTKRRIAITGGVALATLAVGFAAMGSASADDAVRAAPGATIKIKQNKHTGYPVIKAPKTIPVGGMLQIVNKTNTDEVGPNTFSIVTKDALPKGERERKKCGRNDPDRRKLVCKDIALAHDMDGLSANVESVDSGLPNVWDAAFDGDGAVGDSWFTDAKDETHQRAVPATPTKLFYMSIVWTRLQGKIKVVAPG